MTDFSVQITNFQSNGTYIYQFDEVGNVILNPSSSVFQEHFISIPTVNFDYDDSKIQTFYDVTLKEFASPQSTGSVNTIPQDILDQIDNINQQNRQLQAQLNTLISKNEEVSAEAESQLVKDTILALRIQLKQGSSANDFQSVFPYTPISIDNQTTR